MLSIKASNPTQQDQMVVWVFTSICISVKMETSSFFCAWGLHESGVDVFAPRIHFSIAFLSPLDSFNCLNSSYVHCGIKSLCSCTCLERQKILKKSLYLISIRHMQQPSTSTHTNIRSCLVGLKL